MNEFFAKRISASDADSSLIRGVIAENEGLFKDDITIKFEPIGASDKTEPSEELENMFK